MKVIIKIILIYLTLYQSIPARSDDGMWLPHQMKMLDLKSLGLKMNPADLYKKDGTGLMSAIVDFDHGTGEFVSSQGLILTNHHVAFDALQRASSLEHNYLEHGFIAWQREQELQAQGFVADVLLGYDDITDQILSNLSLSMSSKERYEAIDKTKKEIIARAEAAGEDLRCEIASMYSGNQYFLFRFKQLKDIRLVYAPPQDIGNFGGEIDNWMWPRHTADFTFLRAYVSVNNIGVAYDVNNIPYQPKSILKISLAGVNEHDFTFVLGYPGKTYRNFTEAELRFEIERMKKSIELRKELIAFFENAGNASDEIKLKYKSKIKGFHNGLKNFQAKLEWFQKMAVIQKKIEAEKQFVTWLNKEPLRQSKYANCLSDIEIFMKKYTEFYWKKEMLSNLVHRNYGPMLLYQADLIHRTVEERAKLNLERDSDYQERNLFKIKQRLEIAEQEYYLATDKAFFLTQLQKLFALPADQIPVSLIKLIKNTSLDQLAEDTYQQTILTDPSQRIRLMDLTPKELAAQNDPMLDLIAILEQELQALRAEEHIIDQEREDLKKIYLAGLLEMKDGQLASDANGTIRFTCGTVEGYSPRDAVRYLPNTTLRGVIEKDTGEFPFHVPAKLKELYAEKNPGRFIDKSVNDVPTCFLNTTNVTGGSSGSPTLNANGEQVGIIFDMVYESVIGDYYIIPELQRTISVDLRYVLFLTEKFSGATHIIKELGF